MKMLKLPGGGTRVPGVNPPLNFLLSMTIFCSYNVRGLNKKPKQAYVRNLLFDNHVSFVDLVETRVKMHKAVKISRAICKNWNWSFNYDHHYNGRVWVGRDPKIWKVNILFMSAQVIHC